MLGPELNLRVLVLNQGEMANGKKYEQQQIYQLQGLLVLEL
jgi:hypothetical protein